ncbi:MAG: ABC transporter substrate-binding protein [Megasphaera sp.]|jgi:iron complex transport system substrate-binding protein|nr:ABC transporter substrate-binding protein [Megasphaera sp.]MCH4187767.1 ABC transporter substrate-binding protein [Megasphaera sp.]MCH4217820.1 ABC transporter substrate-binding protein [Megasphaera sp.]
MRKWITIVVTVCMAVACLVGCTPQNEATSGTQKSAGVFAEITDDAGRTVTLQEKPQRVVVLSTSLLNFVDAVGGDLAGRATVKSEAATLPERYATVPEVGPVYNVSVEKIIACKPDLVIVSKTQHEKLIPLLEQNNIPVLALKTKTFDDVKRNLAVIGTVYGKEDAAKAKANELDADVQHIIAAMPKDKKKVAIIHATPSEVTVELPASIAGDVASILGFDNVAADGQVTDKDAERVPYSMEALVEKNPDVIFITSMGQSDKIQKRLKQDVENNAAWATLDAVKAGKVVVLPENLFLLSPGLAYPQAVEFMAKAVYPEVF